MLTARLVTFLTIVGLGVAGISALAFLYAFLDYLWSRWHSPTSDQRRH